MDLYWHFIWWFVGLLARKRKYDVAGKAILAPPPSPAEGWAHHLLNGEMACPVLYLFNYP